MVLQRISGGNAGGGTMWTAGYGVGGGSGQGVSVSHGGNDGYVYAIGKRDDGKHFLKKVSVNGGDQVNEVYMGDGVYTSVVAAPYDGQVYVAGYKYGLTPDGCKYSKGGRDAFVCKLNKNTLTYTWCGSMGTGGDETTYASATNICHDMHGNSFLAATSGAAALVAKFDANGNFQWSSKVGGGSETGVACSYDIYYDWVYLLGQTWGQVGQASYGSRDIFVAQIDSRTSGVNWIAQYGGPGDDIATDIQSFKNRVFFLSSVPGGVWQTYWSRDGADVDAIPKSDANSNIRLYYNNQPWGGRDILACEIANVGGPVPTDWTKVPVGMAKWCAIFGSTGDDYSASMRVLPNYDLTWTAAVGGQYVSDGPGNPNVDTPQGGMDVAVQYYWEYDPPLVGILGLLGHRGVMC